MDSVDRRRGHVLLAHAPRDPFSGEEMKQRGATDFSDVFGGPPRRFSLCDNRSSLGESGDDSEPVGRLEREDSTEGGQLWASSFVEKPVFGGFSSPAHRRHLGDDFFKDIFRGNDSPSSTPRRLDRDRLTFSPGSSFLSPSRPLPPATDAPSRDSGSKSPNLSYSSRLAKTFDYSPHKSPTSRNTEKEDRSANSSINSPSRFTSPKASPNLRDEIKKTEDPPMKEEFSSKIGSDHNLHFSMYKWASKGVTLVMPPNLKERSKGRSRLGGVYAQVSQEPDLPSDKENFPRGVPIFQNPDEPEDKTLTLYLNPPVENSKAPEVLRDITDQSDDAGLSVDTRKLKNLRHLIDDEHEIEEKEVPVVDSRKATKGTREDTNLHRLLRSTNKVKESVKNIESRGGGSRESTETKVEEHRQGSKVVNEDENKVKYQTAAIPIAPKFQAERPLSDIPGMQRVVVGSAPMTFLDSRNSIDVSFCEIDATDFENDEDFMLEDLSQECNEVTEASLQEEEIRNSDAKIREWSKGRQGNIRSLLSTLQYVLWPGCGWKPVRLVDIIEGPSVRRAYQRALLYLHPDKLQQKGADMHHKYVAEKVFAILQEAWDQFNSLGAI